MHRAIEVGQRLHASLEAFNAALERAEDAFELKFGPDAYGRVRLEEGVHLVYRDAIFWVETMTVNRPGSSPNVEMLDLMKTSKRVRMLAADRLKDLSTDIAQGMPR